MNGQNKEDFTSPWWSSRLLASGGDPAKCVVEAMRSGVAVYAFHHDGEQVRYSRLSIDLDADRILMHALTLIPPPDIPHQLIQWSSLRRNVQYARGETFLSIKAEVGASFKVYIKLLGDTARGRQHVWLCTGEKDGKSNRGVKFGYHLNKGKEAERIISEAYDGKRAEPLIPGLSKGDNSSQKREEGVVAGALWTDTKSTDTGLFLIYITSEPSLTVSTAFGRVSEGLASLQAAVAASTSIDKLIIEDCGIVLTVDM